VIFRPSQHADPLRGSAAIGKKGGRGTRLGALGADDVLTILYRLEAIVASSGGEHSKHRPGRNKRPATMFPSARLFSVVFCRLEVLMRAMTPDQFAHTSRLLRRFAFPPDYQHRFLPKWLQAKVLHSLMLSGMSATPKANDARSASEPTDASRRPVSAGPAMLNQLSTVGLSWSVLHVFCTCFARVLLMFL
jgi:hypothetical protein